MDVLEKILDLLNESKFPYKRFDHVPVVTSEDAANIRDIDESLGAKSLIFIADNKPILIVVPGCSKVDTLEFKNQFKIKDLRMATISEIKELADLERGGVPPLGKVLGFKSYYDRSFLGNKLVAFNAGKTTVSIVMNVKDLIEIEKPILGDFSKQK